MSDTADVTQQEVDRAERGSAGRALRTGLSRWFALSIVGVAVLLTPDESLRLISLSDTHGLSVIDAVGTIFLLTGWVSYLIPVWRYRAHLVRRELAASLATLGAAVVVWSVLTDTGIWWAAGALLIVFAQVALGASLLRKVQEESDQPANSTFE